MPPATCVKILRVQLADDRVGQVQILADSGRAQAA